MTAKEYATFILHSGLEFNMRVWKINPYPFLFTEEEIVDCLNQELHPQLDKMEAKPWIVTRANFTEIIDDWNIRYFPHEASARQALEEYKKIIQIEDEKTRYAEYDNWIAERGGWRS